MGSQPRQSQQLPVTLCDCELPSESEQRDRPCTGRMLGCGSSPIPLPLCSSSVSEARRLHLFPAKCCFFSFTSPGHTTPSSESMRGRLGPKWEHLSVISGGLGVTQRNPDSSFNARKRHPRQNHSLASTGQKRVALGTPRDPFLCPEDTNVPAVGGQGEDKGRTRGGLTRRDFTPGLA